MLPPKCMAQPFFAFSFFFSLKNHQCIAILGRLHERLNENSDEMSPCSTNALNYALNVPSAGEWDGNEPESVWIYRISI